MFFRKNEVKRAQEEATRVEIERLGALGPEVLAVDVLRVMSAEQLNVSTGVRVQAIVKELLSDFHTSLTSTPACC
jgi:hypothetical protein